MRRTRGVAQGDPLLPTLFNLTLQTALDRLPETVGISVVGVFIHYLDFADNIALIMQTREGFQLSIKTLLDSEYQLRLLPGNKCATMVICV